MFSLILSLPSVWRFVPYGDVIKPHFVISRCPLICLKPQVASYSSSQTHRCLQAPVNSVLNEDIMWNRGCCRWLRPSSKGTLWPWTSTSGLIGLIGSSWPYLSHPKKIIQSSKLRSYVIDGVSLTLEKRRLLKLLISFPLEEEGEKKEDSEVGFSPCIQSRNSLNWW